MQLRIKLFAVAACLSIGVGCGSESANNKKTNVATAGGAGDTDSGGSASGGAPTGKGGSNNTGGGGKASAQAGTNSMTGGGGAGEPTPPRTVHDCDALPGPGTWESVLPSGFTVSAAVWVDPFEAGVVFVSGKDMGIYKSSDCGANWKHLNTGTNGSSLDSGSIVSVAMDPKEKGVMYVTPIYGPGGLWKSTDGGVSWENLFPDGSEVQKTVEYNFMDSISMDPNDHLHLVVGTHGNCAAPYKAACQAETTDGGKNWHIVNIPGDGWQEQAGPWVINATTWLYGAPSGLYITEDNGANWKQIPVEGTTAFGGGEVENHGINRDKDGTYYMTSYAGLVRNKGDLNTWELIPNSGGRIVSMVIGGGNMYTSDQWSPTYHVASESDPTKWMDFKAPYTQPSDSGGVFLDYDPDNKILYSSNFGGGIWRIVTQ